MTPCNSEWSRVNCVVIHRFIACLGLLFPISNLYPTTMENDVCICCEYWELSLFNTDKISTYMQNRQIVGLVLPTMICGPRHSWSNSFFCLFFFRISKGSFYCFGCIVSSYVYRHSVDHDSGSGVAAAVATMLWTFRRLVIKPANLRVMSYRGSLSRLFNIVPKKWIKQIKFRRYSMTRLSVLDRTIFKVILECLDGRLDVGLWLSLWFMNASVLMCHVAVQVMPMFDVPHLSITLGKGPAGMKKEISIC